VIVSLLLLPVDSPVQPARVSAAPLTVAVLMNSRLLLISDKPAMISFSLYHQFKLMVHDDIAH
jgi:hypothetical protein